MFLVKLCVVLFAFTISATCQRDSANSSPPMRLPPPSGTGRKSEEQMAALRRQLMRDNYDYTQSDDEWKHPNETARRGDRTNIYYQKGNVPASEAAQTDSKSYSAEHGQDEQPGEDKQPGQYEKQPAQYKQPYQNEQPGDYVQRSQNEQPGQNEQYGQNEQPGQNEQYGQNEQPGQNEQYGQNEQPGQNEQLGQNEQPGQYVQRSQPGHDSQHEQYGQEEQRNQYDTKPKPRPMSEQEQPEQQFEDQDQVQYEEQTFRSKPAYIDTDELTVRDVNEPKHTLDQSYTDQVQGGTNPARDDTNPNRGDTNSARRETESPSRHKEPAREPAYQPFYNKHPKSYETNRGVALQARPFSDLRGDFNEQNQRGDTNSARPETKPPRRHKGPAREPAYQPFYNKHPKAYATNQGVALQARPFSDLRGDFNEQNGQNDAGVQPEQEEQAENEENEHEDQEAIDQQNISDSQDDGSDYSESKKQSREMYNEFGHTTRSSRLQPSAGRGKSHRGHSSLTYQEPDTPSGYHHATQGRHLKAPRGHDHYRPSNRDRNTPHHQDRKAPLEINIAKKDLLYYTDDTQLRRNNNEMLSDVSDDEEHPLSSAGPSRPALRPSPNLARPTPTRPRVSPTAARASPTLARASPTLAQASPTLSRSSPTVARAIPTSSRANSASTKRPDFLSTNRAHRSSFVTVSPTNVTYKLLTLKSREGRRRGERRILEERRPEGVAIISLDHAPLPAFRLPRARRQYMHEHQRRRPPHV